MSPSLLIFEVLHISASAPVYYYETERCVVV